MKNLDSKNLPMTETANGALAYATSGSAICDQFGVAGNYRDRSYEVVSFEQEKIWEENPKSALIFPFYLRLITRKVKLNGDGKKTQKVQRGQGSRDEAFKRMLSLAKNHPRSFWKVAPFIPIIGSWKDMWTLLYYDKSFGVNALEDGTLFFYLMQECLKMPHFNGLIKKYMPRIKSKRKLKTERSKILQEYAEKFAKFLGLSVKEYNKLKSSGDAHDFQKLISNQAYGELDWGKIPGKALNILADSKFLENHDLVKGFEEWADSQDTIPFTGYVYELYKQATKNMTINKPTRTSNGYFIEPTCSISLPRYKRMTLNKQFDELIRKAEEDGKIKENVWCVLDTSGSMDTSVMGGVKAIEISNSLGIFFAALNKGSFHDSVCMFDRTSTELHLSGNFCDKIEQIPINAMGSTNFQSVVDALIRKRTENPNIPISDYPTTLLVVSDMQFNPTRRRFWERANIDSGVNDKTNYEEMLDKLSAVFPREYCENMRFIWWNVCAEQLNVPATIDDRGCILLSGFDGSIISLILGIEPKINENGERVQPSMVDMVNEAFSQEIFKDFEV